jgi:2-furoyl-CoA dehydrogenase large subunit
MSTPVCIANAVADALRPLRGECDVRIPLTPSRVLEWLAVPDPAPQKIVAKPAGAAPLPATPVLTLETPSTDASITQRLRRWLGGAR